MTTLRKIEFANIGSNALLVIALVFGILNAHWAEIGIILILILPILFSSNVLGLILGIIDLKNELNLSKEGVIHSQKIISIFLIGYHGIQFIVVLSMSIYLLVPPT